jgi:hypothetical protein
MQKIKKSLGLHRGIENGMDLMQLRNDFLKLFRKKEEVKVAIKDIDFITLAKSSCDKIYIETLKLNQMK